MKITIKETQNPAIVKFEFPDFITQNESFEFKNIDETKNSPLAQQLFYLPFVKNRNGQLRFFSWVWLPLFYRLDLLFLIAN